MNNPHDLLENVLLDIESNVKTNITADMLAKKHYISSTHLQRLFKFAFEQTLGSYIKQRKLAASLDCLLTTDMNILNVAIEFGFEYEQTYIRAFKRIFGATPGEVRKTEKIVDVLPPLHLYDARKITEGILMKPVMVMVPTFYVIGKRHKVRRYDSLSKSPLLAKQFWQHERKLIENTLHPELYIGLTRIPKHETGYTFYLPSVQVHDLRNIPDGMEGDTIEASLSVRYRYIGKHHYYDLNARVAKSIYEAIKALETDKEFKYSLYRNDMYFERIDTSAYDGKYCQMEWFSPVCEKQAVATSPFRWSDNTACSIDDEKC
ncbi:MAG: helix-turn-helix transcriptional regulator [Lachnospiraceae bacterium]|jgi:AraC family transcriptional regulator|nr:helix-turn-helix transcriptional regulator [Lachnospiraceae bacterium]